jgi:uncharacterized membrane protein YccC
MLLAGSLWATFITIVWPLGNSSFGASSPSSSSPGSKMPLEIPSDSALKLYGIKLGIGVSIATLLVYLLNFQHVGWAPTAVAIILRPQQDLIKRRGFGRVAGTFVGILVAWLMYHVFTQDLARAAIIGTVGAVSVGYSRTVLSSLPIASTTAIILLLAISETTLFSVQGLFRLLDNVVAFGIVVVVESVLQKFTQFQ